MVQKILTSNLLNKYNVVPNYNLFRVFVTNYCNLPDKTKEYDRPMAMPLDVKKVTELPEEPTTCCMSGCANCVWIDYANKLTEYFKDEGEKANKEIMDKVTDSNIRAFLLMELRTMKYKSVT